jgi:hypothetical protein
MNAEATYALVTMLEAIRLEIRAQSYCHLEGCGPEATTLEEQAGRRAEEALAAGPAALREKQRKP